MRKGSSIAVVDWDVDGIASGIMMKNLGLIDDIIIPPVGEYILSDPIIDILTGYEDIYFLDIIPSPKSLSRLRSSHITIIDHATYCPEPDNDIESICMETYSTTYLIMKTYKLQPSNIVLYGLLNDIGGEIRESKVFREFMSDLGVDDEDISRILEIINILNIPMYFSDINLLYENISLIEDNIDSLIGIPSLDRRIEYRDRLENILYEMISNIEIKDGYAFLSYDMELYLIRRLPIEVYRITHLPSIILDSGYFDEYIQIASYCPACDFRGLIKYFRELGYAAGGGRNFIGVMVENEEDIEGLLNKVISLFH